jgi:conjugative transfer signal peptidase TraF
MRLVPEARDLPLFRWGEDIRRERAVRRDQRLRSAAAAAAVFLVVVLLGTLVWPPRPFLVWNVSESAPVGLYLVGARSNVRPGEMVVAWTPDDFRAFAAERRYLPSNVPLVKRIAAAAGDRVCAAGEAIWVNGRHVASRRHSDGHGRPMPSWTGCRDLTAGEYFLLMDHPDSFDGRYFGLTHNEDLVGRAVLLWSR